MIHIFREKNKINIKLPNPGMSKIAIVLVEFSFSISLLTVAIIYSRKVEYIHFDSESLILIAAAVFKPNLNHLFMFNIIFFCIE